MLPENFRCYLVDKNDEGEVAGRITEVASADHFAERLALTVDPATGDTQLLSVAVDGETFGHHSAFGDMCMAAFFTEKARPRGFQVTNYAEYLEQQPARHEVELEVGDAGEGSSWSCAHGVGRWVRVWSSQ